MEEYGLWLPPDTIQIHKGLTGTLLCDTLFHEIGHVAYFIYAPKGEEAQVRAVSTAIAEALHRNKALRNLVERNIC